MKKRDRMIFGVLLPVGIMIIALMVIMAVDTGASAAEFASLGIMLGAITVAPIVLVVNVVFALKEADSAMACFKRGMIAPGTVVIGAIIYQTGLWDAIT